VSGPAPTAAASEQVPPIADGGLDERIRSALSAEFVGRAVAPYLRTVDSPGDTFEASVVRDIGTGRVTIRYDFGRGHVAFGKLFADDTGYHAFRILGRLWSEGFGDGSANRVCQPLAYLPKEHFLLVNSVPGTPLTALVDNDDAALPGACRAAARWLVQLHSHKLLSGNSLPLWDSLRMTHVVHRMLRACQAAPETEEVLSGMLKAVWTRGGKPQESVGPVQTHGRFHHEHIYLHPGAVSVIDFDGCTPSDPARDLGEFLTVLRVRRFRKTGESASVDGATRVFLAEYLSALPWNGTNLPLFWGAYLMESLLKVVRKSSGDEPNFEKAMEHFSKELYDVLSWKFVPPELQM